MIKRIIAVSLTLLLFASDFTMADPDPKDVYGNQTTKDTGNPAPSAPVAAAPAPASTSAGPTPSTTGRDPLIEVSVDSLEISETNTNILGFLWGQTGQVTNGVQLQDQNHLNFIESTVPSIFNAGNFNRTQLMAQMQALIQSNQVRVLANPTLLTKSGFEATFLVGGEIPYPTPGQLGQIGVEFKKYGVALKILPQLTPRNTIDAVISVGVSNPDSSVAIQISGVNVPGLSAREASTKVEVLDGETVVLAGIKQSRRTKIITKVPILGSIPLLGLLFQNKEDDLTQTSLVFFVTFRLVK